MTYAGMPPFLPAPGLFWIGGQAAALTGSPGWEMFKPWAITSVVVREVAMVLWSQLIRFEYALAVTTATATVVLAYGSTRLRRVVRRSTEVPGAGAGLVRSARRIGLRVGRGRRCGTVPRLHRHLLQLFLRIHGRGHGGGRLCRDPPGRSRADYRRR